MKKLFLIFALASVALWAEPQDIMFPASLDKLADKADEVVNVTLDGSMLSFASAFMSDSDPEEKAAKEVVKGLGGIYIRAYTFSEEGQYSMDDIKEIQSQMTMPTWVPIVSVQSKKNRENAQVFFKKDGDKISGITIIAAEPTELAIVHIVGSINPSDVAKLSGQFGIPDVDISPDDTEN
jgi:uncharacterized protein DUF4252